MGVCEIISRFTILNVTAVFWGAVLFPDQPSTANIGVQENIILSGIILFYYIFSCQMEFA